MKKRNGFTLVELLIVMAILAILAVMMIGIFNATGITNKGRDAKRKKDLYRIKIAFEDYFNDKGSYPNGELLDKLRNKDNCNSSVVFAPWLVPWPCDPDGNPYEINITTNKFRILINLENKSDKDILSDWYTRKDIFLGLGFTPNDVNYGVSSSNILWYSKFVSPNCDINECSNFDENNCNMAGFIYPGGCVGNSGNGFNCYYGISCVEECKTNCCGSNCKD